MSSTEMDPKQAKKLKRDLQYYWTQMAYVTNTKRFNNMKEYLLEAQKNYDEGDIIQSQVLFYRAKREFIVARTKREIFYSRSSRGMLFATILVILFSLGILAIWLLQEGMLFKTLTQSGIIVDTSQIANIIAPFLAALGGGIGGCAAVLIKAIDVDPESEIVSKTLWYGIKPVLGAALGLISYFAIISGLSVLASGVTINNFAGAVIIGFLAGFFESFSTGILARIASQFSEQEQKNDDAANEKGEQESKIVNANEVK